MLQKVCTNNYELKKGTKVASYKVICYKQFILKIYGRHFNSHKNNTEIIIMLGQATREKNELDKLRLVSTSEGSIPYLYFAQFHVY